MLMCARADGVAQQKVRRLLFVAVWGGLGVFDAIDTQIKNPTRSFVIPPGQGLLLGLALWYTWGLLSLGVFAFARRFPFTRGNWRRRLPLALGFVVLVALVKIVLDYPAVEAFCCPEPGLMPLPRFLRMAFTDQFHFYVLVSVGLLAGAHVWNAYREHHRRAVGAWQLEARLAQTRLELLRAQLHPHFLFNTLGAISHLIRHDADEADRILARLGDLLRHMLDTAGEPAVLLSQEIDFLRAYLDIERARFGERLCVAVDVEPGLEAALVPPLVLQPLAENAIRHGVARRPGGGRIEVRARRAGGKIRLEVWDDGPGISDLPLARRRKGLGLANTRARLEQLFGDGARLEVGNDAVGVLASLELPYAEEASSPRDPAPTKAAS